MKRMSCMKRLLCAALLLALAASFCALMALPGVMPQAAARGFTANEMINPDGYPLLMICGASYNNAGEQTVTVCFGDIKEENGGLVFNGFDAVMFRLKLAQGCETLMPRNMDEIDAVSPVGDVVAWFNGLVAADYDSTLQALTVYASYDMTSDGELTRLEYYRLP